MSVPSDTQYLKINAAVVSDELLIVGTIGRDILLGLPVQEMEMSRVDIDMVKKVLVIERVVTVRVAARQPEKFIEAEDIALEKNRDARSGADPQGSGTIPIGVLPAARPSRNAGLLLTA